MKALVSCLQSSKSNMLFRVLLVVFSYSLRYLLWKSSPFLTSKQQLKDNNVDVCSSLRDKEVCFIHWAWHSSKGWDKSVDVAWMWLFVGLAGRSVWERVTFICQSVYLLLLKEVPFCLRMLSLIVVCWDVSAHSCRITDTLLQYSTWHCASVCREECIHEACHLMWG